MMKGLLTVLFGLFISVSHASVGHEVALKTFDLNVQDETRLQRGAKMYMNYCSGCHSLRFMRYNRMAHDLGLTTFDGELDTDLLFSNLIFTQAKVFDPIQISMPPEDAMQWFGIVPPDLSLSAREKGPFWIYTYLTSFYADKTRPFGSNNLLKPDVAMPNVLEPLAGKIIAVDNNNNPNLTAISHLLQVEKGEMNLAEFESAVQDLVTFLAYVSEPAQLVRYDIGKGVLIYLGVFLVLAYLLKKVYWRRLHK
ncbi:cytochrome c1 [Legionella sp. MW5194]|uniref:cytochrome c1 n=1 Tax=Legionella sp. MW5194 TaxID=2662448 RepID=UPI00351C57C3